jgi:hypothetical protein
VDVDLKAEIAPKKRKKRRCSEELQDFLYGRRDASFAAWNSFMAV